MVTADGVLKEGRDRPAGPFAVCLALVGHGMRQVLVFRADVIVGTVSTVSRVILVMLVWNAVYGARGTVSGVDREDAVGYAALGALFAVVFQPWHFSNLNSRVRDGNVVFDIMRPVGLLTQTLAAQIGSSLANVPKAAVGLALALLLGAIPGPSTWWQTAAFVLSACLGLVIAVQCNLIVGLTAFWTTDVGGAYMIYSMAAAFCSGSLIPLWFMPDTLAGALRALPFSAQIFTPLSIWFDRAPGWAVLGELALQVGWIAVLTVTARAVWSRALRRTVINGG